MALDYFSVIRNATKNVLNKNGLFENIPSHVPAFEFNPDGTFKGCLIEPPDSNFIQNNEDYTEQGWNTTRVQVFKETEETIDPFGTFKANRIRVSLSGSPARLFYSFTQSNIAGTKLNVSSFVKPKNTEEVTFRISNNIESRGVEIVYNFSTNNYTISYLNTITPNYELPEINYIDISKIIIQFFPETGWYRFSFGGKVASGQTSVRFSCGTPGGSSVILNDEIYNYGASINLGKDVPHSVIISNGGVTTRNSDNIYKLNASSQIGQVKGSVKVIAEITSVIGVTGQTLSGRRRIWTISDGTDMNRLALELNDNVLSVIKDTTTGLIPTSALTPGVYQIELLYDATSITLKVNGATIGTSPTSGSGTYNRIDLGQAENNTLQLKGHIKLLAINK